MAALALAWIAPPLTADVVYFTTNTGVDQVTQGGTPSVFVQETGDGSGGNHLNQPLGIAIDQTGNLFVDNVENGDIVKITPGGSTSVFYNANTTTGIYRGLAVDSSGNVYAADTGGTVDKITASGGESTIASGLPQPLNIALAPDGTIYSGNRNNTITKITTGGAVSTFSSGLSDGLAGGLAVDATGNVYVAGTASIHEISPDGNVSTFATGLQSPDGFAFTAGGVLYAVNGDASNTVLAITPAGAESTFGTGVVAGYVAALETPEPSSVAIILCAAVGLSSHRPRRENEKGASLINLTGDFLPAPLSRATNLIQPLPITQRPPAASPTIPQHPPTHQQPTALRPTNIRPPNPPSVHGPAPTTPLPHPSPYDVQANPQYRPYSDMIRQYFQRD